MSNSCRFIKITWIFGITRPTESIITYIAAAGKSSYFLYWVITIESYQNILYILVQYYYAKKKKNIETYSYIYI